MSEEERIEAQGALDDETVGIRRADLAAALDIVDGAIEAEGPCDHGVNLCVCGAKSVADTLRDALGMRRAYFPRVEALEAEERAP